MTAVLSRDGAMNSKDEQYRRIYNQVVSELEARPHEELYGELLAKEKQTLDTVNRIIDHDRRKRAAKASWLEIPAEGLFRESLKKTADLVKALLSATTLDEAWAALTGDTHALLCAGGVLVILAIVFFLASTPYD